MNKHPYPSPEWEASLKAKTRQKALKILAQYMIYYTGDIRISSHAIFLQQAEQTLQALEKANTEK